MRPYVFHQQDSNIKPLEWLNIVNDMWIWFVSNIFLAICNKDAISHKALA
jgi:hypothetical protein